VQPSHTHTFSLLEAGGGRSEFRHSSNDLVTGDDGEFDLGKLSLYCMKIRVTDATDMDPDKDLISVRFGGRTIDQS
jgi:hypothetical protein